MYAHTHIPIDTKSCELYEYDILISCSNWYLLHAERRVQQCHTEISQLKSLSHQLVWAANRSQIENKEKKRWKKHNNTKSNK